MKQADDKKKKIKQVQQAIGDLAKDKQASVASKRQ